MGRLCGYTIGLVRYAITDGVLQPGACVDWAADSVDFVQLRNKAADAGELAGMARAMLEELEGSETKLLVNGRADVAVAVGAAGVHLTGHPEELLPKQVRALMPGAVVSVSCHSLEDVERALKTGADWILFGPVFEKRVGGSLVAAGLGVDDLCSACAAAPGRVLALGGVTKANAGSCVSAGAAGVAGVRLFGAGRVSL